MSSLAQCILLLISLCLGDIFVVAQPRSRAKSKPPETSDSVTQKAATFFESGQEAHAAGKFEEAIKLYSQAITLDSALWQAEFQQASAYFSLHRFSEARTSINQVTVLTRSQRSFGFANGLSRFVIGDKNLR